MASGLGGVTSHTPTGCQAEQLSARADAMFFLAGARATVFFAGEREMRRTRARERDECARVYQQWWVRPRAYFGVESFRYDWIKFGRLIDFCKLKL